MPADDSFRGRANMQRRGSMGGCYCHQPPRREYVRHMTVRGRAHMQRRGSPEDSCSPLPNREYVRQMTAGVPGNGLLSAKRRNLLKMIIATLQPLETTEDSNFKHFVEALNPEFQIPTKAEIRSDILSIYKEKVKDLRQKLASVDDIVLTCELWSSKAEDSYLTVGCHHIDPHGNLMSFMLKTTSLFGDKSDVNIGSQLAAVAEAWGVTEKVHTVVGASMPILKNVGKKWTHMPCFADTLNVVFKDLMTDKELSNVFRKCQNIIRFFKNDSEAEKKLKEIQRLVDKEQEQEELIMYSGDRWLPSLHMLQRLIHQHSSMIVVLEKRKKGDLILNDNDKKVIENIISALEPLSEATSKMKQKGFETLSAMLPLLMKLMNNLEQESEENSVAKKLWSRCEKEFGDVNNHKLATITFLDPRFKNQLGDQNKRQAMDKIMKELSEGPACSSTSNPRELLDNYMSYEPNAEKSNPLAWWRHTGKKRFGELSQLALKKMGVVSTAVPLERAFSSASDQFCDRRSSIAPENLNMMLFLHSNWP